jgi:hypothetical protein
MSLRKGVVSALNGQVTTGNPKEHIGHGFHPHRHLDGKDCSGRWYCEKCKVFISGPKCTEAK